MCSWPRPIRPDEAVPRIILPQSRFRERDDLVDTVFKNRIEQFLFGGEPPVHRAHPDVGVVGDVIERRFQAAHGEQLTRGFDDPLPVALGVLAQPAARFVNHAAEFSDLPYENQ